MSHLRVGDIEIDGHRVTIGSRPTDANALVRQLPGQTIPLVRAPTDPLVAQDPLAGLDQFPIPAHWTGKIGLGLVALGGAGLLWAPPSELFSFLFHGGSFVLMGMGLVVAGRLQRVRLARKEAAETQRELTVLAPVIERLRPLLAEPDPTHSFEWIRDETRLPGDVLVRALALMRDRGDLIEEYSGPTSTWHYFCAPQTLNLEARMRRLRSTTP